MSVCGLAFCLDCERDGSFECQETLASLTTADAKALIRDYKGILWYAPTDREFWLVPIFQVVHKRKWERNPPTPFWSGYLLRNGCIDLDVTRNEDPHFIPTLLVP